MAFWKRATAQAAANGWQQQNPNTWTAGQQAAAPPPAANWEEEEEEISGAAWWIRIIIVAAYAVAVIVFAWQTWQLVNTIFPADNRFMKIATVCTLDVMSLVFALAEMLYPFLSRHAKHLAFGMWLTTFLGALAASMIYMYLNSIQVLHGVVDMSILVWAYAIVVLVMAADVLSVTVGIRMEVGAYQQLKRRQKLIRRQQAQAAQNTQVQPIYSPAASANNLTPITAGDTRLNDVVIQLLLQHLQQPGGNTDKLPLVQPPQQHQSTGSMPKQPSAKKAPQAAKGTMQP